ncbi:MAG: hypothetical protein JO064_09930, partial [Actinobacteria bacterium]|nr:hypothetical protein [Actinomycetota bacterium]
MPFLRRTACLLAAACVTTLTWVGTAWAGGAISAKAASSITATSATLNADTSACGAGTAVFEYGPTTSYGSSVSASGSGTATTTGAATGLTASTTYHFHVKYTVGGSACLNAGNGPDGTFTTLSGQASTADPALAQSISPS